MDQNQFSNPILVKGKSDTINITYRPNTIDSTSNYISSMQTITDSVSNNMQSTTEHDSKSSNTQVESLSGYQRSSWFVITLVITLILVAKIKLSFPKLTSTVFQSILRYTFVQKLLYSRNSRNTLGYIFMNTLALMSISLFILEYGVYHNLFSEPNLRTLIYIILIIFSFALFKIIIIKTLGYLLKSKTEAREYNFGFLLVSKSIGMVLIPIVICLPYIVLSTVELLNIIGLTLIISAYVLIILRGLKILFIKHVSLLYMILYLCALEIVPAIFIYKIMIAQ